MNLYLSTFSLVTAHGSQVIQPTVAASLPPGWSAVDFRTKGAGETSTAGRCLVGSTTFLASPPAGVTFLLDTATDLDTAIPNGMVTAINNFLGISIPNGTTWRQAFRRLFRSDGAGKWGTIFADAVANFGPAGTFTF